MAACDRVATGISTHLGYAKYAPSPGLMEIIRKSRIYTKQDVRTCTGSTIHFDSCSMIH